MRTSKRLDAACGFLAAMAWMVLGQGVALAQLPGLPALSPAEPRPEPRAASRPSKVFIPTDVIEDKAPDGIAGHELTLASIALEGNTQVPTAVLAPLWQAQIGRTVTVEDLFGIARKISAEYRSRGYLLTVALVPRQEIDAAGGRVRVRVFEGRIAEVEVLPRDLKGADHVRATLEPVVARQPPMSADLIDRMLRLNDLPGLTAQAGLRKSQDPAAKDGASDLVVTTEHEPWAFQASVHNRVSEATGPVRLEASVERRGLLAAFDRHALRVGNSGSDRLWVLGYSGEAPIGTQGLFLNWGLSGSRADPLTGADFNLDTRSTSASLGASYTALRGLDRNLFVRGSLTGYNGSTELVQTATKEEQRLRVLRLGARGDVVDPSGGTWVSDLELSAGLKGLGASAAGDPVLGRIATDPQFRKLTLFLARTQNFGDGWSVQVAVNGQYSRDVLPNSEQFGLGGESFLRAYDPSELLGDHGAAVKLELRRAFAWKLGPQSALESIRAVFYGFADAGRVVLKGPLDDETAVSARSYGVGLRAEWPQGMSAYFELAKPHGRPTNRYRDERVRGFAGFSWQR